MIELERDLQKMGKTLSLLPEKHFDKTGKEIVLSAGASPILTAIRQRTPVGKMQKHSTKDGIKKAGTLRKSVQVFKSRKDKNSNAVLIGNVLRKTSKISSVKGSQRVSKAKSKRAYYARIVTAKKKGSWRPRNGRTVLPAKTFIQDGYNASKSKAASNIIREGNRIINQFKRKYSF